MAENPLKKYFRQPKIYVDLPSKGVYVAPGTLVGDPEKMAIFGMTGMDEILMKTPDALLSGEGTVKVIESCCPVIKDAWNISILDLDLLLVAIRIATYGNTMSITHTCSKCEALNDFEIELGNIVNHFKQCVYDNKVVLKDLVINLRPITYRAWTEFQLKNFAIQRQLVQTSRLEDTDAQNKIMPDLFKQLSVMQKEALIAQIDSVEISEGVVDQASYISEFIMNSEQIVFEKIKEQVDKNRVAWEIPKMSVTCPECGSEEMTTINIDQSDFFANA